MRNVVSKLKGKEHSQIKPPNNVQLFFFANLPLFFSFLSILFSLRKTQKTSRKIFNFTSYILLTSTSTAQQRKKKRKLRETSRRWMGKFPCKRPPHTCLSSSPHGKKGEREGRRQPNEAKMNMRGIAKACCVTRARGKMTRIMENIWIGCPVELQTRHLSAISVTLSQNNQIEGE